VGDRVGDQVGDRVEDREYEVRHECGSICEIAYEDVTVANKFPESENDEIGNDDDAAVKQQFSIVIFDELEKSLDPISRELFEKIQKRIIRLEFRLYTTEPDDDIKLL
jgi:hypothetical protein